MVKAYLLFVLVAMTAIVVASRWLPIWAATVVIPVSFLFFVWLGFALVKRGVRALYAQSLEEQSIVMRGATVTVHAVEACGQPAEFEETDAEAADGEEPDRWVRIEMTVRPDEASVAQSREQVEEGGGRWMATGFSLMEPGVVLDPKREGVLKMFSMPCGRAVKAECVDGSPVPTPEHEELTLTGPARVRVVFRVPSELPEKVAVRYHHVELAEVSLPTNV